MLSSYSLTIMHQITGLLLEPVVWGLMFFLALSLWESGLALGERCGGLQRLRERGDAERAMRQGRRRIERADFITRICPMLGLMGTLIPLGPGLSALGDGELSILTTAMTVAFDTTVMGLLGGILGFVLGRLRRRWYDQLLTQIESRPRLDPVKLKEAA
ncbi:putative transporter PduT for various metalloporphyrin [Marinobacterium lacunae]|uniref:Putative transporter PduT for various metalloporphyrin n=1 Tax=Marinobacterium lacunae TaxID=1232683 RepID=A0A081FZS6_9GAMM|nr:MotA/TolQ/ExbB proton channel family protein [Marinobacterium lacunae]KEA64031.1 putative transporter PduT for various metalloporphyrin [Marinobacterium lacunae]MBR9885624.1 flagellar motor protein MotA [Oceanospirillales bacterium]